MLAGATFASAVVTLLVYTDTMPGFHRFDAERCGHFFEFGTEIVNGCFALFYAVNSYNGFTVKLEGQSSNGEESKPLMSV